MSASSTLSSIDNSLRDVSVGEMVKQTREPFRARHPEPGTRNRATMAAEILLDGEAETLTGKAVELG
jgi:hypothetical protein